MLDDSPPPPQDPPQARVSAAPAQAQNINQIMADQLAMQQQHQMLQQQWNQMRQQQAFINTMVSACFAWQ